MINSVWVCFWQLQIVKILNSMYRIWEVLFAYYMMIGALNTCKIWCFKWNMAENNQKYVLLMTDYTVCYNLMVQRVFLAYNYVHVKMCEVMCERRIKPIH